MNKNITIQVRKFEDAVDQSFIDECEVPITRISDEALAWFQTACDKILKHPLMKPEEIHREHPEGDCTDIEVIFVDSEAGHEIFDSYHKSLGTYVLITPDGDPFNDDTPFLTKHRIAIYWDPKKIASYILGDAVTKSDIDRNGLSWLGTVTHELQHAIMFMENSNFNTPNDTNSMEEEIGADIFDIVTSYGIRALNIGGELIDGEDAEHQNELMEKYVEERGMIIANDTFSGELSVDAFLKCSGLEERVKQEVPYLYDDYRSSALNM